MFHQNEGRGPDNARRGRPNQFNECRGRGPRRHHNDEPAGFGPGGPGFGPGFGPGGPGGPRGFGRGAGHRGPGRLGWLPRDFVFGPGRGPMVRRGDVRTAILALLAEEPMHGYQIIQKLGERSGGMWRPSAGSVYPTLQQLEDEGLVRGEEKDGRNVFALTEEGKQAAEKVAKNPAPWNMAGPDEATNLFGLFMPLGNAVAEVSRTGNPETIAKARVILTETRRSLYRLLAEDDQPESSEPTDSV